MKKQKSFVLAVFFLATMILAACGGGGGGEEAAVSAGKSLFEQPVIGSQAGCSTCHSLEAGVVIVGPSLAGIATRAASTVSGLSADAYIRQSILEPDAHVVEGFTPGVMVSVWGDELTGEQIDNLVAFLMTLK